MSGHRVVAAYGGWEYTCLACDEAWYADTWRQAMWLVSGHRAWHNIPVLAR